MYKKNSRVVVAQPTRDVWDYENHWNKGLSDCCDDVKECCYAYFCFICYVS